MLSGLEVQHDLLISVSNSDGKGRSWANFRLQYLHMSELVPCSSQIDVVLVQLFVRNLESPLKGIELKW